MHTTHTHTHTYTRKHWRESCFCLLTYTVLSFLLTLLLMLLAGRSAAAARAVRDTHLRRPCHHRVFGALVFYIFYSIFSWNTLSVCCYEILFACDVLPSIVSLVRWFSFLFYIFLEYIRVCCYYLVCINVTNNHLKGRYFLMRRS